MCDSVGADMTLSSLAAMSPDRIMNSRFVHLSVFAVFCLRGLQTDCNTGFNSKDGKQNVLFVRNS